MKRKLIIVIIQFMFAMTVSAQANFHSVYFDKDEYNASSKNWDVASNDKGMIYVGNSDGLLQFDGVHWKLYELPNRNGIRAVYTANDRIYTGGFEEFGYWEPDITGLLHYTSLSEGLEQDEIDNVHIWKVLEFEGRIFFQSFARIYIYEEGTGISTMVLRPNIAFLIKNNGSLYAHGNNAGLMKFSDKDGFKVMPEGESLKNAEIKTVLPFGKDGLLLGGGGGGLFVSDGGGFKRWESEAGNALQGKNINCGLWDGTFYYFGTISDGLYVVDSTGRVRHNFNTERGLLHNNTIHGIHLDKRGNIWLAQDKGITLINQQYPLLSVIDQNAKIGTVYTAMLFEGMLYVGTNQGVYYQKKPEIFDQLLNLDDFELLEGSTGQTWELQIIDGELICGHNRGTFVIRDNRFVKISDVAGGFAFQTLERNQKTYLIESSYTTLAVFEKDAQHNWSFARHLTGLSEPIRFLEEDHRGNLWASHRRKGVYRIKLDNKLEAITDLQYYGENKGFSVDFNIHVFKVDNRIVFTSPNGIFTYNDLENTIVPYEFLHESLGEFRLAHRIVEAQHNLYWFILRDKIGLFSISGTEIRAVVQFHFNKKGHHMVEEFENIIPLDEHLHLICLENGFALFDPLAKKEQAYADTVRMVEVLHNEMGERLPLKLGKEEYPKIDYRNNFINFSFSPFTFSSFNSLFSYQLEGLDSAWSDYGDQTTMTYTRLPWGKYRFRVRGINEFGEALEETSYAFEVRPPWYATSLAYLIYSLIAIGIVIGVPIGVKVYLKNHKRKLKEQNERITREKQREEQIQNEQKIIKLKNQFLKNQLDSKSNELANITMSNIRNNEALIKVIHKIEEYKEEYGTRFPKKAFSKITAMINHIISEKDDWIEFQKNFDKAHNNFFKRLMEKYPDLTQNDLRICAYLHMNLTTKEIATLLNISVRGVEVRRYRLRKKLNLAPEDNLVQFFMQF